MSLKYLIETPTAKAPEVEHTVLKRFHHFLGNFFDFLVSMGISPGESWFLIEVQMEELVSPMIGDVDILAGKLEPADPKHFEELLREWNEKNPDAHPSRSYRAAVNDLAMNGGLKWIPSLDYLVGVEVKSCHSPLMTDNSAVRKMKSTKSSPKAVKKIRGQVDKLAMMGFNKVGLFEFIANPPADGIGNQPWHRASKICGDSMDAMKSIFGERLPKGSFVGHAACSVGGVIGGEEHQSGAYESRVFRQAQDNPLLKETVVKDNRRKMEQNLARILNDIPNPRNTPAVFVCDKGTRQVHFVNEGISIW